LAAAEDAWRRSTADAEQARADGVFKSPIARHRMNVADDAVEALRNNAIAGRNRPYLPTRREGNCALGMDGIDAARRGCEHHLTCGRDVQDIILSVAVGGAFAVATNQNVASLGLVVR